MNQLSRLGYAFGCSLVLVCLTMIGLALVSIDLGLRIIQSYGEWFTLYWCAIFLVAYLLIPRINAYLRARHGEHTQQSMGFLKRCAYATAITLVASIVAFVVLVLTSKDWARSFFYDNYFAGIFVIAFLLAPAVDRYLKSNKRIVRKGTQ